MKGNTEKRREVTFDVFLDLLKTSMKHNETKSIHQAFQVIRKGFSGELTGGHVDAVFDLLKGWEFLEILATKLVSDQINGKLRPFGKALLNRIRFHFIQNSDYPISTNGVNVSIYEIRDWIKRAFTSEFQKSAENYDLQDPPERTPSLVSLDKRLRIMFVCLSNDWEKGFIDEAIDLVLGEYFDTCSKAPKIPKISYFNSINKALLSKNPGVSIEGILVTSAPFKEVARAARESEADLWRRNKTLQAKIENLNSAETALKVTVNELQNEKMLLNNEVAILRAKLEEWKAENRDLDHHWQELSKHKLTKQAGETQSRIRAQIEEIRLNLEKQPPDAQLALKLLQKIERILGD